MDLEDLVRTMEGACVRLPLPLSLRGWVACDWLGVRVAVAFALLGGRCRASGGLRVYL